MLNSIEVRYYAEDGLAEYKSNGADQSTIVFAGQFVIFLNGEADFIGPPSAVKEELRSRLEQIFTDRPDIAEFLSSKRLISRDTEEAGGSVKIRYPYIQKATGISFQL
jgi:hypothetical protein